MKKNKLKNNTNLNFDLTKVGLIGHNFIKHRTVKYFTGPNGKSPAKEWLNTISDKLTSSIVFRRISAASIGQFGDHKFLGSGVFELRIHYGAGYRIYYGIYNDEVILILIAGSKKTQTNDIEKAKAYWIFYKETTND